MPTRSSTRSTSWSRSRVTCWAPTGWRSLSLARIRAVSNGYWSSGAAPTSLGRRRHAAILAIELRGIPSAAELRDQVHARYQRLALNTQQIDLIGKARSLCRDDARVGDDPGLVLIERQLFGQSRIPDRCALQFALVLQYTQTHQIIFHRLEG